MTSPVSGNKPIYLEAQEASDAPNPVQQLAQETLAKQCHYCQKHLKTYQSVKLCKCEKVFCAAHYFFKDHNCQAKSFVELVPNEAKKQKSFHESLGRGDTAY